MTWEIQDSLLVLTTAGFGGRETVFALSEAAADPTFRPGLSLLCDLRLEIDDPSWEEMRTRAKFVASLLHLGISHRCAFVIGLHQYGIARMAAAYLEFEGMEPEVFRDFDEARAWLACASPCEPATRKLEAKSAEAKSFGSTSAQAMRPTGTTSRRPT